MKKLIKFLSIPLAAMLFLVACSNDEDKVENDETQTENGVDTETKTDTGTDTDTGTKSEDANNATYSFKDFELEVEYKDNKDYSVEYDTLDTETEATIEDEVNKTHLHGDQAMEKLSPMFKKLTFTKDSSEDEVIKEVIKVFNLKEDYKEFDLEITFDDNTKKEYKEVK